MVHIGTSTGEDIETTENHPFYVDGRGWVAASEVKEGDQLHTEDGSVIIVTYNRGEWLREPVKVYNLEVEGLHTYYVTVDRVLVHNEYGDAESKPKNKTGPKPKGTGPHNNKIEEIGNQISDGDIVAGGGKEPEKLITIENGIKSGRRPDILVKLPDGSYYGINVGKTTAGGAPIKREVEALYDLESAGIAMFFVGYD